MNLIEGIIASLIGVSVVLIVGILMFSGIDESSVEYKLNDIQFISKEYEEASSTPMVTTVNKVTTITYIEKDESWNVNVFANVNGLHKKTRCKTNESTFHAIDKKSNLSASIGLSKSDLLYCDDHSLFIKP